jgi:hypothetical protein
MRISSREPQPDLLSSFCKIQAAQTSHGQSAGAERIVSEGHFIDALVVVSVRFCGIHRAARRDATRVDESGDAPIASFPNSRR